MVGCPVDIGVWGRKVEFMGRRGRRVLEMERKEGGLGDELLGICIVRLGGGGRLDGGSEEIGVGLGSGGFGIIERSIAGNSILDEKYLHFILAATSRKVGQF